MDKILLALGLPVGTSEEDAVKAIDGLKQKNETMRLARITEVVEAAIAERRITADQREHFMTLGKNTSAEEIATTLKMFPTTPRPSDIPSGSGGSQGAEQRKFKDYDSAELELMKKEDRSNYVKLYKEEFGFEPKI